MYCEMKDYKIHLAEQNYRDLNFMAKFNSDEKFVKIFNDDRVDWSILRREHLFYLQVTGVFMTSEAIPTTELKKWNGERGICNLKGKKKKLHFIGREILPATFSKLILTQPWTFLGSEIIPGQLPPEGCNLWPIKTGSRTVFL